MKNKLILYCSNGLTEHLEVRLENETVWLPHNQIVQLVDRVKSIISKHLRNVFKTDEIQYKSTVTKKVTIQNLVGRSVTRESKFYNLDAIISVRYRVNFKRGMQFRIWAKKL